MNNKTKSQAEILEEIEIRSESISKDEINDIISEEEKISKRSSSLDIKKFGRFVKQMKLALNLLKDFRNKSYTDIPWRSIGFIAAAVLYFMNPFDVVPDMLPVFGFGDDVIFFAAVFKSIQTDLEKYAGWKGINTKDYF